MTSTQCSTAACRACESVRIYIKDLERGKRVTSSAFRKRLKSRRYYTVSGTQSEMERVSSKGELY